MRRPTLVFFVFITCWLSLFGTAHPYAGETNRLIAPTVNALKDSPGHLAMRESRRDRDFNVGDTRAFWRWNLSVMPPTWVQTPATCRAVGTHCYIFVADDQWNLHMDQSDVDHALAYLETDTVSELGYGIVEMDTLLFGPIPDELDNDPRITVFYSALGSYQGSDFDGYFSLYNQVTEAEAQMMSPIGHSNECEMIYMTCYPLDPAEPIRFSVLAHELEHLIHWGGDPQEETWIDEGCAELAMVKFGVPDPIISFQSHPDLSLITWEQDMADYIKVMLFFTYLYEHCGGDSLIRHIVLNPTAGLPGLRQSLIETGMAIPLESVFVNWALANYIDNPEPGGGVYDYPTLNLPSFSHSATHQVYPVEAEGTLQPWAADYIRFRGLEGDVGFSMSMNGLVPVTILMLDEAGLVSQILPWTATSEIDQSVYVSPEVGDVILVVTNNTLSALEYQYGMTPVTSIPHVEQPQPPLRVSVFPNPSTFSEGVRFSFGDDMTQKPVKLSIYNVLGQRIAQRVVLPGESSDWRQGTPDFFPSSGVYFYCAEIDGKAHTGKILLLR